MPRQPDRTSSPSTADTDIEPEARHSPVLRLMIKNGVPLTRENYIDLAYGPGEADDWTAEHEMALPVMFQRDPLPKTASCDDE